MKINLCRFCILVRKCLLNALNRQIALVHETGHAVGQLFPKYFHKLNATFSGADRALLFSGEGYAVNFENRYRRSIGVDIRTSYSPILLDPIHNFDVDLFPTE